MLYDTIFDQILGCTFKIHIDIWQQPAFITDTTQGSNILSIHTLYNKINILVLQLTKLLRKQYMRVVIL